jgi:hypothetical protein
MIREAKNWMLAGVALLVSVACAPESNDPAAVVDELVGTTAAAANARSEFENSALFANQYLVVTVNVTKDTVTPIRANLIRGPQKANSSIDDLRVRSLARSVLVFEYSAPDPRFRQRHIGTGTALPDEWIELPSAEMKIFVPLSPAIRRVEIVPAPGRGLVVSGGGDFDPAPLAKVACAGADPVTFPACTPVMALVL